jgi:hypothetical protein
MKNASICWLRAALVGGIYVAVLVAATVNPLPGLSSEVFEWVSALSEIALGIGAVTPLLVVIGVVLARLSRRRLTALDWVSIAFGVGAVSLPVLFFLAYANCPNGAC